MSDSKSKPVKVTYRELQHMIVSEDEYLYIKILQSENES